MKTVTPLARYGATNPTPDGEDASPFRRFASVIGCKPELEQYYRDLHANVWPTVLDRIRKSNMRNYSIYVAELDGRRYLFSYFEYVGRDLVTDMKAIADDPETQRWWKETDPCQIPLPGRKPGAHWQELERVFCLA